MTDAERREMAECHFEVIRIVLSRYLKNTPDMVYYREEFESLGYEVLLIAAERFDPERGVAFVTFLSRGLESRFRNLAKQTRRENNKKVYLSELVEYHKEPYTLDNEENEEVDTGLVELLEPEAEVSKEIYYRLILGDATKRQQIADEFGLTNKAVKRRKQCLVEKLRKQYTNIFGEYKNEN